MTSTKFSLLYIVGWCRSGSTIVGNVLNEIDGFFHAGELHYLWRNTKGLGSNTLCGCGAEINECCVWSEVVRRLSLRHDWSRLVDQVIEMQNMCRTRHTWQILKSSSKLSQLEAYTEAYLEVCETLAEVTKSRVLIDGGKFASEAALLRLSARWPVKILHLVRDPRDVAASWSKPKGYIDSMSAWSSTCNWLGFNAAGNALAEAFAGEVHFVRYEDFAAKPVEVITNVLEFLGEDPALCPIQGREVVLSGNHTVTGNPDRLVSGRVAIKDTGMAAPAYFDPRWLTATLLSLPQRRRYGYV